METQVMSKHRPRRQRLSVAKLDEMIEQVTVDAYGESEQAVGFFTLLAERAPEWGEGFTRTAERAIKA